VAKEIKNKALTHAGKSAESQKSGEGNQEKSITACRQIREKSKEWRRKSRIKRHGMPENLQQVKRVAKEIKN